MDQEFPQTYRNDEGYETTALNEVQGAAFEKQGFKPVGKPTEKRARQQ